MKLHLLTATACLGLLLLSVGCLEFVDQEPPIETVVIEGPLSSALQDRVTDPSTELLSLPDPETYVNDPCSCDSLACLERWVTKNLGCDVCVVLYCGANRSHVCARCDTTP